jgi:hypothetical protein
VCELTKDRLAVEVGVGVRRHAGLAAPGGGDHRELASGEAAVRLRPHVAREPRVRGREGAGGVGRRRTSVGTGAQRRQLWWHGGTARPRAREESGPGLISDERAGARLRG